MELWDSLFIPGGGEVGAPMVERLGLHNIGYYKGKKLKVEELVAKQKVPWGGIEFTIKPANKLRKVLERLHIYMPYLHGGKPLFRLALKRLSEPEQIQSIYWFVRFSNGDMTGNTIKIPKLVTDEVRELEIGDRLLGFTGDTYVGIVLSDKNYQTLYSFRTIAQEDFTVYAMIAFVGGFLATIFVSWL